MTQVRSKKRKARSLEYFVAQLTEAFAAEYKRGAEDTAERISSLVTPSISKKAAIKKSEAMKVATRAPRGAARELVISALNGGMRSIGDIRSFAKTPVHKKLSYQTVRLELERGKKDGKYKKGKDGWSII